MIESILSPSLISTFLSLCNSEWLVSFFVLAGADFSAPLGSISVSRSTYRSCITVQILDDSVIEDPEEFVLVLTADDALSRISQPSSARIIIVDNDGMLDLVDNSLVVVNLV